MEASVRSRKTTAGGYQQRAALTSQRREEEAFWLSSNLSNFVALTSNKLVDVAAHSAVGTRMETSDRNSAIYCLRNSRVPSFEMF